MKKASAVAQKKQTTCAVPMPLAEAICPCQSWDLLRRSVAPPVESGGDAVTRPVNTRNTEGGTRIGLGVCGTRCDLHLAALASHLRLKTVRWFRSSFGERFSENMSRSSLPAVFSPAFNLLQSVYILLREICHFWLGMSFPSLGRIIQQYTAIYFVDYFGTQKKRDGERAEKDSKQLKRTTQPRRMLR